jgi:hypothetical protein
MHGVHDDYLLVCVYTVDGGGTQLLGTLLSKSYDFKFSKIKKLASTDTVLPQFYTRV